MVSPSPSYPSLPIGALKTRFRILKIPILFQKLHEVDNVFFTCCVLHNMLLCHDGLDEHAEGDVDWEHLEGLFGAADCEGGREADEAADQEQVGSVWTDRHEEPVVIAPRSDYSADGFNPFTNHTMVAEREEVEGTHQELTQLLIDNFQYMWSKKLVQWLPS